MMYEDHDDYDEDELEELDERPRIWRRVLLIVISLILIFAILATTILPAILAAERNDFLRNLPTPTTLPRT